jgi:hypothetical protein
MESYRQFSYHFEIADDIVISYWGIGVMSLAAVRLLQDAVNIFVLSIHSFRIL